MRICLLVLCCLGALAAADRKPVYPPGTKPGGPYSPGILTSDSLYVAGQGARDEAGSMPEGVEAQTVAVLQHVRNIVEAAGLTMEHIVYTQVHLADMSQYDAMNRGFAKIFPSNPPARAVFGVRRMPTDTPVEINAIAVRDLSKKAAIRPAGAPESGPASFAVKGGDRLYFSGVLGKHSGDNRLPAKAEQQVELAFRQLETVLKSGGYNLTSVVYANIYRTSQLPEAAAEAVARKRLRPGTPYSIVETAGLPEGANVEISGFAEPGGKKSNVEYVALKMGQTKDMLSSFRQDLLSRGLKLENLLAVSVYIDDVDHFAAMNQDYMSVLPDPRPARTTVQPTPPAAGKPCAMSAIVLRD